ncbi:MAG TPA: NAD(P)/FAD-dependent oxidoreductase [Vicinamibacterales bacterium]|nr:NAD(P)/FAD-dependent oxidoreductase [Vicinamibacterales bacterium]
MTLKQSGSAGAGALTRRTFLEQFSLVGGSALVMSAMRSWELMAAQAGPRPVLSGRPNGTKVIILGAGVSGMTVGYELGKLGYNVRILEARDRVGGVNWSLRRGATHTEVGPGGETQVCNFDEGLYHNGGPWRLAHWHTGVLGYCKELGVPVEIFINENESSYFYYEGDNLGPLAAKKVRLREVKADMMGYTCELMAKAINQDTLDMPLTAADKERFVTFLVSQGYLDSADHAYKKNTGRGPGDPHDFKSLLQAGFANRIRSVMDGTGMAPMFQPVGGMDQFPKGFARKLGDKITHGVEVVSIHQTTDGVKVAYKNLKTGAMTEVTADYCVSCLPLTILSTLDVNLSPETMAAAKATPYSPSAKIGLQMKRRFWEEDDKIFGGHLYSNLPVGDVAYPSWGYWGNKGVMLGFYGNGQMSGLVNKPVKDRIEHVLTHVGKVHPQIRTEFETAYCTFWEKTPYSLGAFAGGGGNGNNERLATLGKPDGRIFLGCAAISGNGGWQEGAVAAAWKQVKQLHEMAMKRTQTA